MRNIIHEEAERIKQNIINEFGENNVLDLQVYLNDDWRGDYSAWWVILKNNRRIECGRYYNSDGTIKKNITLF